MALEYAIDGLFSTKSDIFSFGVIVLEVMSSKRNRKFHHTDHDLNLLGQAWKLWMDGKAYELIDPVIEGLFPMSKVLRCIQIGLLCVQKCSKDRPTMSSVVAIFRYFRRSRVLLFRSNRMPKGLQMRSLRVPLFASHRKAAVNAMQ
ncbi:receptor-like serine/threonine-protein kinase SD1-8 [Rhododendron vialii]|uniref:receptor-like serine/threonine-protein kinase SD1-8 n=1 Tax=Rhododendron vialii TaxID=182163 RepID=UPI00265F3C30|nr:receptor-like serine/threonine-protein kinase SD1-8 [Rhododendron vialii]